MTASTIYQTSLLVEHALLYFIVFYASIWLIVLILMHFDAIWGFFYQIGDFTIKIVTIPFRYHFFRKNVPYRRIPGVDRIKTYRNEGVDKSDRPTWWRDCMESMERAEITVLTGRKDENMSTDDDNAAQLDENAAQFVQLTVPSMLVAFTAQTSDGNEQFQVRLNPAKVVYFREMTGTSWRSGNAFPDRNKAFTRIELDGGQYINIAESLEEVERKLNDALYGTAWPVSYLDR